MSLSGVNSSPLRDKPLALEPRPTTTGSGTSSLLGSKTSDNPQIGMAPIQLCALADPPAAPAAPTSYATRAGARDDFEHILSRMAAGAGAQANNEYRGERGDPAKFLAAADALQSGVIDGTAVTNLRHLGFTNGDIEDFRINPRARMLASTIIRYVQGNWTDGEFRPFSQGTGVNYIYDDIGNDQACGGCISPGDLNGLRTATGTGNSTNRENATRHSNALWQAIDQAVIR